MIPPYHFKPPCEWNDQDFYDFWRDQEAEEEERLEEEENRR